jgi:hypothetical protein
MAAYRRSSGFVDIPVYGDETHPDTHVGASPTPAKNITRVTAKRYAAISFGAVMLLIAGVVMLNAHADLLTTNLLDNAPVLADAIQQEHNCTLTRTNSETEWTARKQLLRKLRRTKNADAMKLSHENQACEAALQKLDSVRIPALNYEIASLDAKVGNNETLITLYRMVEALAKLQDRQPMELWATGMVDGEQLRNSVILEMSQRLGAPLNKLQELHTIELFQQVANL